MRHTLFLIMIIPLILTDSLMFLGDTPSSELKCPTPEYKYDDLIDDLIDSLYSVREFDQYTKTVEDTLSKDGSWLSYDQLERIIQSAIDYDYILHILPILTKHTFGITTKEFLQLIEIIGQGRSKHTMESFSFLKDAILDISPSNKERIINHFNSRSDVEWVEKFLADVRPKDCLFGDVTESIVTFVVDISEGMNSPIASINVNDITRYGYVKERIKWTIKNQLKSTTKFNIILYNKDVIKFREDPVNASISNEEAAFEFLDKAHPQLASDAVGGLYEAFKTKLPLEKVILVAHGPSTSGDVNIEFVREEVMAMIEDKYKETGVRTIVDVIDLCIGGNESQEEKFTGEIFLFEISKAGNGVIRIFP